MTPSCPNCQHFRPDPQSSEHEFWLQFGTCANAQMEAGSPPYASTERESGDCGKDGKNFVEKGAK